MNADENGGANSFATVAGQPAAVEAHRISGFCCSAYFSSLTIQSWQSTVSMATQISRLKLLPVIQPRAITHRPPRSTSTSSPGSSAISL
jgi:hypothetical protein